MARLHRLHKLQRRDWPRGALLQSVIGHDFFGNAFGNDENFDHEWARQFYETHRDQVFDEIARRNERGGITRLRPDFWWRFEASEPRDFDIDEAEQLRRMGELD